MVNATNMDAYRNSQRMPTVLIVDDDVDVVLQVERTLQMMGCNTIAALNFAEAQRELMTGKVDLVILDWQLEKGRLASNLLNKVTSTLDKFLKSPPDESGAAAKTVIVTHSALPEDEVKVPQSDYFICVDHWMKPVERNELVRRTSEVLRAVGF